MTPSVRIEAASIDDVDTIVRVMDTAFDPRHGEAWTADQCRASCALPGYRWLIASCDGECAGFLLSRTVARDSEMMLLAVAPCHRGAGIGRALVDRWLDECRSDQVERVFLEVRDGNPALAFYLGFGFVEIGRRKAYYSGDGNARSDAITMTLGID